MKDIFKEISHEKILIHDEFFKDLEKLFKNDLRGFQKSFVILFRRVIKHMMDFSVQEIQFVDGHERLKNCRFPCYSLHLRGSGFNVRFLVTEVRNRYLLLLAFNEKEYRDYAYFIDKAYARYLDWSGISE